MVIKWDVTIPRLSGDTPRRAYIYLPESYDEEPDRRYPVMYMFDGHNVFFDEDATFGKSWGMNDYMERTGKQLIIVGVECNHQGNCRLSEYSPVTFENAELGKIRGRGSTTMNWMVNELKPYIDEHFRTLSDRRNTILAGSSMGGLMALYGATAYNSAFQRAACLADMRGGFGSLAPARLPYAASRPGALRRRARGKRRNPGGKDRRQPSFFAAR